MDVQIPCPCPLKADGTVRHESDTVSLKDTLTFRERLSLRQTIKWARETSDDISEGELLAALTEGYVLQCISAWSLVDEKGKPLPPSRANIREVLLTRDDLAMPVADAADELYSEVILLPLLLGASNSSRSTQTPENPASPPRTSVTPDGKTPPKPSKRSSTTTIPTVVTGPMLASPAGGSSSSPS